MRRYRSPPQHPPSPPRPQINEGLPSEPAAKAPYVPPERSNIADKLSGVLADNGYTVRDLDALEKNPAAKEQFYKNLGSAHRKGYEPSPDTIDMIRERLANRTAAQTPAPVIVMPTPPAETPISRPMVDPSLLSPSGRVSARAEAAAKARATEELFGPGGMKAPGLPEQPTQAAALRQQAQQLRNLAARGMKPKAYNAKAAQLEAQADALESPPSRPFTEAERARATAEAMRLMRGRPYAY